MKTFGLHILLWLGLCLSPILARATHLIAGNLGYELVGYYPGPPGYPDYLKYKVTLQAYMDCGSINWGSTFPESTVEIGVYPGTANQTGGMVPELAFNLNLISASPVDPSLPPGCTFASGTCIRIVLYEAEVNLPVNQSGYHFIYDRCCRPSGITNLDNSGIQGMVFQAWAPPYDPTPIDNSSPVFTDTLVSYMCVNDTFSFLNQAIDPDGDSLVYSLVRPYDGKTDQNAPVFNYGQNYIWPPTQVNYAAGFNASIPFGNTGLATIDPSNGLTQFYSTLTGTFVLTVNIYEYRNGQLIGISQRNIQIIVITCPNNDKPRLANFQSTAAKVGRLFFVQADQQTCMTFTFSDQNQDNIKLDFVTGNLFNSSVAQPAPTYQVTQSSAGSLEVEVCWTPNCQMASNTPFDFTIQVIDNGCPPKTRAESFQVLVIGPQLADSIIGPDLLCLPEDDTAVFGVPLNSDLNYDWSISSNGQVLGADSLNELLVQHSSSSSGTASVVVTTNTGCYLGTLSKSFVIGGPVEANAGIDTAFCLNQSYQLRGSQSTGNIQNYLWNLGGSTSVQADVSITPIDSREYTLEVRDAAGCFDRDTVVIGVYPLPTALANSIEPICLGDAIQLIAQGGVNYAWSPANGLSDANIANPTASPTQPTTYTVTVSDINGCTDTDTTFAFVQTPLDFSLEFDSILFDGQEFLASVNTEQELLYSWQPAGAFICPTCQTVSSVFYEDTEIFVSIEDPFGCYYADTTFEITVIQEYSVFIPNSFTPDGDGINDTFFPKTFGIRDIVYFGIYDRWGNEMFATEILGDGWDGYHQGNRVQNNSVFVYRLLVEQYNGDQHEYYGKCIVVY